MFNSRFPKLIVRSCILVACLAIVNLALAESFAIVMGVSDYATGINAYAASQNLEKVKSDDVNLPGAENDARDFASMLEDKYRLKEEDIKLRLNQDVSSANFGSDLKWLAGTVLPGDNVLIYFSGHGTHVASKDEPGSYDEAIVLGDATVAWDKDMQDICNFFTKAGRERNVCLRFLFQWRYVQRRAVL